MHEVLHMSPCMMTFMRSPYMMTFMTSPYMVTFMGSSCMVTVTWGPCMTTSKDWEIQRQVLYHKKAAYKGRISDRGTETIAPMEGQC